MYGTSEIQYGELLKDYSRDSHILQTKVAPKENVDEFRAVLEASFKRRPLNGDIRLCESSLPREL